MDTTAHRITAKIYQFPLQPRLAAAQRLRNAEVIAEAMPQHVCNALDNCWYHDEAVRDSAGSAIS